MVRTTPGSGWIEKNCYQDCYHRGAGLAERSPNAQFGRAVAAGVLHQAPRAVAVRVLRSVVPSSTAWKLC